MSNDTPQALVAEAEAAGEALASELIRIMRAVGMPNGLTGAGYRESDCAALADGAWPQQRLLQNAPIETSPGALAELYRTALQYW